MFTNLVMVGRPNAHGHLYLTVHLSAPECHRVLANRPDQCPSAPCLLAPLPHRGCPRFLIASLRDCTHPGPAALHRIACNARIAPHCTHCTHCTPCTHCPHCT